MDIIEKVDTENELIDDQTSDVELGVVTDCTVLNIRKEPYLDSEIICKVNHLTELMVCKNELLDEFYRVYTVSGVEGFCMKKYITIR